MYAPVSGGPNNTIGGRRYRRFVPFNFFPSLAATHLQAPLKKALRYSRPHSPAGMSLTKLSLGGNNDVIYKLFPPRESLESDIPAGDGNIEKLFLWCGVLVIDSRLATLQTK